MKTQKLAAYGMILTLLIGGSRVYADTLYPSSVVGTDFDYITAEDPNTFMCLEFEAADTYELPDKRDDNAPLMKQGYKFNAYFTDGTKVDIVIDGQFGSEELAETEALRYTSRLGKLPTLYRENIEYVNVHQGGRDVTAFAEDEGHFFTVYSDNAAQRIQTNDLEETFFHEGTHAGIQLVYMASQEWKSARADDDATVTNYGRVNEQEDFAETALIAYTLIHHPQRLPAADRSKIETLIPNKLEFFKTIFQSPVMYQVRGKHTCSKNAIRSTEDLDVVALQSSGTDSAEIELDSEEDNDEKERMGSTEGRNIMYGNQSVDDALWDVLVLDLGVDEAEVIDFIEPWKHTEYTTAKQNELFSAAAQEFDLEVGSIEQSFEARYGTSENILEGEPSSDKKKNLQRMIISLLEKLLSLLSS